jgi:hypothetical protein
MTAPRRRYLRERAVVSSWHRIAYLGALLVLFGGMVALAAETGALVGSALVLVGAVVLIFFVIWFRAAGRADERTAQRGRDRRAAALLEDMKNGGIEFFLYLRPFASTGGVQIVRSITPRRVRGGVVTGVLEVCWNDLEALLAKCLEPHGPLIGLGRPGEQIGAGRITSDEESWQKLVTALAANARLLFLLPALDSGTRWEMDLVFSQPGLLGKTIFIVPGSHRITDYVKATEPLPGLELSVNPVMWAFERDRRFERLPDTMLKHLSMGALKSPERSSEELRLGALEALRATGMPGAAAWAERSPNGILIKLDSQRSVRDAHPLSGRIRDMFSLTSAYYRLDLRALKRMLGEFVEETQEPSGSQPGIRPGPAGPGARPA